MIAIMLVLVFLPACIALLMHDHFVRALDTAGKKWMWYGAYSCIISWVVVAAKFVRIRGNILDIQTAFNTVRSFTVYGLLAIATAIIAPLLLSLLCILFAKKSKKGNDHEHKDETSS